MSRVTIKSVHIKNFRSIKDSKKIEINGKVTTFAGKNESGKTNILKAIQAFSDDEISEDDIPVNDKDSNPEIKISFEMDKDYIDEKCKKSIKLDKEKYSLIVTRSKNYRDSFEGNILAELYNNFVVKCYENEEYKSLISQSKLREIFNDTLTLREEELDDNLREFFKDRTEEEKSKIVNYLKSIIIEKNYIKLLHSLIPQIAFFDSFNDVLPDELSVAEINSPDFENKHKVFINLLKLLGISKDEFRKKIEGNVRGQASEFKKLSKEITQKYNSVYSQENVSIGLDKNGDKVFIQIYDEGDSENDKKPSQRSKGFQWFIAFYLLLNSIDDDAIILIDEPGLYLHAKAQEDILKFLNDEVNNMILYTTHSPYLIDINNLYNLNLVRRDEKEGTIINQKYYDCKDTDTMTPIVTAIGYNVAKNPVEIGNGLNVITEGLSDRFYLLSFLKLLNNDSNINIIPSIGSSNIHMLVSLAIGWGLDYKILLDKDQGATAAIAKLKLLYKDENEMNKKIIYAVDNGEIEDIFSSADKRKYNISKNKKVISSYNFYRKVMDKTITLDGLEQETQDKINALIKKIIE